MGKAASRAPGTVRRTTMTTMVTTALVLAALAMIARLATTGRVSGFSPGRAQLASRSLHSTNATLILSAAALAGLVLSIASHADRWHAVSDQLGGTLAAGLVVAVIALVAFRSVDAILGILGFGAEVVAAGLEHGAAGAMSVVVLAMLLVVFLGFVRGFVRAG
jgi:hypothetical protein